MSRSREVILQESNPEILRFYINELFKHNDQLSKTLTKAIEEKAKAAQKSFSLEDQLLILKKKFFGKSSEKRKIEDRVRDTEDQDLLVHSYSLVPPASRKNTKSLDEEVVTHSLTDEELQAMSVALGLVQPTSAQWEAMPGFFDESTEVTVIERSYKKLIHRRQKYCLKKEFQNEDSKMQIITAEGPLKLLPGCTYSIDFAASVVADKYISHLPLERQIKQMSSLGLHGLSAKTLYNMCWAVAEHLHPLAGKIKSEVLKQTVVHADETPWPINNSKDSDGYFWVISNQAGSYYRFESTRSGDVIKEIIGNYHGVILCDGYTGYNRIKLNAGVVVANCWAHARRKFADIEENYPTECKEILDLIEELFRVERKARSLTELVDLRESQSEIVVEKIKVWLQENLVKARAESGLRSAIEYAMKYWQGLVLFLKNENIPLTNNEAERTIRHAVLGRKNFHGSRTINGADVAATLYTVIESCKKVEIDPRTFILETVKNIVSGKVVLTPLEMARRQRESQ